MEEPSHHSVQVLVVDDDPALRWIAVAILGAAGFTLREAADGQEALASMRTGLAPDLVLLDLDMPVMDGASFFAAMRADPRLCRIPVVLYSGESDLPARARALGTAGFLAKPSDLESLVDVVRRHSGDVRVRVPARRTTRPSLRPARLPGCPSTLPP